MTLDVGVPNTQYWKEAIECQAACPVHTDARGYVRAIAQGNYELAYLIARGPNPIASMCGQVCGAPCEDACRRGELDRPISIRALKRFACSMYGPEARPEGGNGLVEYLKEAAKRLGPRTNEDNEELLPMLQALTNKNITSVENKSVGVIGSGPSGLTAAHDLALLGFSVTIYEREPVLAGMLAVGVPAYRLRRDLIRAEVEAITSMGVEAVTNCTIGKDISFPELRTKHDAVVIAVGMKSSRLLPIPGVDAEGVLGGVEFLRSTWLGNPPKVGPRIVVVGGGSVAYDVSRTALRYVSMDAARTAVRTQGVTKVDLCCLESVEEMTAETFEIMHGDEEGVGRYNRLGPKEILMDDSGKVRGIRMMKCLRVFDDEGRFSPKFDEGATKEFECDNVLLSIGQSLDVSFIDAERDGLTMLPNGAIKCDPETGETDADDVFIAGDLAYGAKLMIHAVASGKSAARAIYKRMTGREIKMEDVELHFPIPEYEREKHYEKQPRLSPSAIPVSERLGALDTVVENTYTEKEAQCEAGRCLDCGVNTIFDGERCILCGGCVDVCPELCLRIVSLSEMAGSAELDSVVQAQLDDMKSDDACAIVKDETICIRCALCAERCPVGAITMERFCFEEKLSCQAD